MNDFSARSGTGSAGGFVRQHGPKQVIGELRRRNGVLFGVAVVHAVLLVAFLAGIGLDPRTVGGEPVWLKPAKFAASIALFTATLGWIGYHLPVSGRFLRRVSLGIAVAAFVEIALIGGQAGRGVGSHFNDSTALDGLVYTVMGVTIVAMTVLVAWLLVRSWGREFAVARAYALGITVGLALFVLGALEGGVMVALDTSAVGSGWSVPVVGWLVSGDFRVAHFVGLHALQVLPLTGYLAAVGAKRGVVDRPTRVVLAVGAGYALVLVVTFVHALVPVVQ